jgi:hypothetical protein
MKLLFFVLCRDVLDVPSVEHVENRVAIVVSGSSI